MLKTPASHMHSRAKAETCLTSPFMLARYHNILLSSLSTDYVLNYSSYLCDQDVEILLPQIKIFVDKIGFLSSVCFSNKESIGYHCFESRKMHLYVGDFVIQAVGVTGENACVYTGTSGFHFATCQIPKFLWYVRWVYFLKWCLPLYLLL